jgi:hypothetical protein
MHKSIQQTIKDSAKALRAGVAPEVARWALVTEGWEAKRAGIIVRWAQVSAGMNIKSNKGMLVE